MQKRFTKLLGIMLSLVMIISILPKNIVLAEDVDVTTATKPPITIIYTNDIHSHIDNSGLTYSKIAGLKKRLISEGTPTLLVDAGDFSQGTIYGSIDQGASIIRIMNETGYDLAALGNHEFDNGIPQMKTLLKGAKFATVSCNFIKVSTKKTVYKPYKVFDMNGTKVAFVGISTPETIKSTSPKYFMDKAGKKYVYDITSTKALYKNVQSAVNAARKEADYVIAIGHLGIEDTSTGNRSVDVIKKTEGIDAFIDAHSHSTVEKITIKNKNNKEIILTQTGNFLNAVGMLTIDNSGSINTKLVKEIADVDSTVKDIEDQWTAQVKEDMGATVATTNIDFIVGKKNEAGEYVRYVRNSETNMADLVVDSFYYTLNTKTEKGCDFAIYNGGGVRADVNTENGKHNWSALDCKSVLPFGNVLCTVKATGQQIKDYLEFGARFVGEGESGGFAHVSGLTYKIDSSVPNTVSVNDDQIWTKGPEKYRVHSIKIYNKKTKKYEALDLKKKYIVGGCNYTLRKMGDGVAMFNKCKMVSDDVEQDFISFLNYISSFKDDNNDKIPDIKSANSPLQKYKNFKINYENPIGGSKRIIAK